jgi:hypothetical protein
MVGTPQPGSCRRDAAIHAANAQSGSISGQSLIRAPIKIAVQMMYGRDRPAKQPIPPFLRPRGTEVTARKAFPAILRLRDRSYRKPIE